MFTSGVILTGIDWNTPVRYRNFCENDQAQLLLSSLFFRREDGVHGSLRKLHDWHAASFSVSKTLRSYGHPRTLPVYDRKFFTLYLSFSNLRHLKHHIKWGEKNRVSYFILNQKVFTIVGFVLRLLWLLLITFSLQIF